MAKLGLEHDYIKCNCNEERCPYCGGELVTCSVCDASEGELLKYCPGFKLSDDAKDACYLTGKIIDLYYYKTFIKKSNVTRK